MTSQSDALQRLAEEVDSLCVAELDSSDMDRFELSDLLGRAAEALREAALSATPPSSEAVAWIEHHKAGDNLVWDNPGVTTSSAKPPTPLYASPQPTRKEQK